MQSYVFYGRQSGRQQCMLLVAYHATSMTVRHAIDSMVVVNGCGRSKVCGLYISCVPAPMQGANLWYSLHNRCIQQDTLNIIACPDSGRCLELLFAVHNNIACFDAGLQFASAGLWHLCCQECIQPELALITCMSEHVETMDCVWLFVTCSSMQKKLSLMCTAAGLDYNLHVATGDRRNSSNTSGVLAGARKDTEGMRSHQRDTLV